LVRWLIRRRFRFLQLVDSSALSLSSAGWFVGAFVGSLVDSSALSLVD
jgi:hypothetical protein